MGFMEVRRKIEKLVFLENGCTNPDKEKDVMGLNNRMLEKKL